VKTGVTVHVGILVTFLQLTSLQTCTSPTKTVPGHCPPVCAIFCPYGNVPDENGCPTCRCSELSISAFDLLTSHYAGERVSAHNKQLCVFTRCLSFQLVYRNSAFMLMPLKR